MAVYEKNTYNTAVIGKMSAPIKMVIEHESDLLTKAGGPCDWLFNVEKSNRFAESIVGMREFSTFHYTPEGNGATSDTIREMFSKSIEHVQFMKEFAITAEMMEDANYGIAADAKRRIQSFVRAYHRTRHELCTKALINGTKSSVAFAGATIDLTTPDGSPLFSSTHYFNDSPTPTQSNYFSCQLYKDSSTGKPSTELFAVALYKLTAKLRNMFDENGNSMGYNADTIVLPGNQPILEAVAKSVCGSENIAGSANNDINLHYGKWNIIVLPTWHSADERMIVMSSEANKCLGGNMFFNRIPLTVSNWIDHHTGNYLWSGRCRFGVGFGSYKHILMAVDQSGNTENTEAIA